MKVAIRVVHFFKHLPQRRTGDLATQRFRSRLANGDMDPSIPIVLKKRGLAVGRVTRSEGDAHGWCEAPADLTRGRHLIQINAVRLLPWLFL